MENDLPGVHPTRPTEKMISFAGSLVMRSGASELIRNAMLRLTRPTYTRSLRMIPSRLELPFLLNARRSTGLGVEIGVDEGAFSEYLLKYWQGRQLISVDPWLEMAPGEYTDTCNTSQATMEQKYETTKQRLASFRDRSEVRRQTSVQAAADIEPHSLDFVYLDARHSYEGVSEDLHAWFPLVREGGLMSGHDYNDGVFLEGVHGVRSAVDEFFAARGIAVRHTYTDLPSPSWIAQIPQR